MTVWVASHEIMHEGAVVLSVHGSPDGARLACEALLQKISAEPVEWFGDDEHWLTPWRAREHRGEVVRYEVEP